MTANDTRAQSKIPVLSFPYIPNPYPLSPPVLTPEELNKVAATKFVSTCAKVLLLILDPARRPPMPTRKDTIDFLDFVAENCDRQIQTLERGLK